MNAAAHFGSRYAAPAAATGTLLALSLSPAVAEAKAEAKKMADVSAVKKSIADLIEDDAERRGDGTSLTGTFVRVSRLCMFLPLKNQRRYEKLFISNTSCVLLPVGMALCGNLLQGRWRGWLEWCSDEIQSRGKLGCQCWVGHP